MNIFPKIKQWIIQHKTITIAAIALPFAYYSYRKKHHIILDKNRCIHNHNTNNEKQGMNDSLKDVLFEIITHKEVMEKIETCLYDVIQSSKIHDTFKAIAYEVVNHLIKNEEYIDLLKERFRKIIEKKEVKREIEKLFKYINNDWSLENEISNFIEFILNDNSVIDALSKMAKECSNKAMDTQRTINEFDVFIQELLSNEELIKMIYNKAIEFFKISNTQNDNTNEYKH